MLEVNQIQSLREMIRNWRQADETIVLVPTMGNLHAGHLSLVEAAQDLGQRVVVSIFVNPTQFIAGEDFEDYPRTMSSDLDKLSPLNPDVVFVPEVKDVYRNGLENLTRVAVPALDGIFCGASRPGHFTGVATVVTKLFNLVQPDIAVFGEKDYQQLLVIRRLVTDLNIPIEVIGLPTVREKDGLALSSRNQYLTDEEREIAPKLYENLGKLAKELGENSKNYRELEKKYLSKLESAGFIVDYLSICDADDLSIINSLSGSAVVLAAAWLGKARLIDNMLVRH